MIDNDPNARTDQDIDENLRRVFRQMEESSLPDRFTDLLQQLREKDRDTGTKA